MPSTRSSDVATFGTLAVLGNGQIFGMRGIMPLDAIGNFGHNVTLGIDFKDFDENIRLSLEDGLRTAIKYVNWSASYGFGWTLADSTHGRLGRGVVGHARLRQRRPRVRAEALQGARELRLFLGHGAALARAFSATATALRQRGWPGNTRTCR